MAEEVEEEEGGDKKLPQKKKLPRDGEWAQRKKKMDVLRGGVINNAVSSECRGEQWHCVEKRWRILLSFLSQTALSINYFYVFIHYFIPIQMPRVSFNRLWPYSSSREAQHSMSAHQVCLVWSPVSMWSHLSTFT